SDSQCGQTSHSSSVTPLRSPPRTHTHSFSGVRFSAPAQPSGADQMAKYLHDDHRQLLRSLEHRKAGTSENPSRILRCLAIDGQAEHANSLAAGFDHSLTRVLDAVASFVRVDVVRPS